MEDRKLHEETKKIAKALIEKDPVLKDWVTEKFPELKESEDERIRKEIIDLVEKQMPKSENKKWMLAWLEKQGEIIDEYEDKLDRCACESFDKGYKSAIEKQGEHAEWSERYIADVFEKVGLAKIVRELKNDALTNALQDAMIEIGKQDEQKPTDEVEPKFKVGDWVIDKQGIAYQIANVVENVTLHTYGYDTVGGGYFNDNTEGVRPWTIQDAKDGNVLCYEDEVFNEVFILKNYVLFHKIVYHCCYDGENFIPHSIYSLTKDDFNKIHPATKEQSNTLMKAMADAGYTFDFAKKELKKIEQKSAWSEEDEWKRNELLQYLKEKGDYRSTWYSWLKSLKDRVQPKQEWSENDEKMFSGLNSIVEGWYNTMSEKEKEYYGDCGYIDWLKSIKERIHPQSEWNEEDKGNLLDVKCVIDEVWHNQDVREEIGLSDEELELLWHWLDNIWQRVEYPQNRWKPTEEQMRALNAINLLGELSYVGQGDLLVKLYQDLKNL